MAANETKSNDDQSVPERIAPPVVPSVVPVSNRLGWMDRLVLVVLGSILVLVMVLILTRWGGRWAWWMDLPNHVRPQLGLGLLLAVLIVGVRRRLSGRTRLTWMTLGLLGTVVAWAPLASYYGVDGPDGPDGPRAPKTPSPDWVVVHANVARGDVDLQALGEWCVEHGAIVISLQEVTSGVMARAQAAFADDYVCVAVEAREDTRGVALWVRFDLAEKVQARVIRLTASDRPAVVLEWDHTDGPWTMLGFSTRRPTSASGFATQREDFAAAAAWARSAHDQGQGALLIGDFNATAQGIWVRKLVAETDLVDARSFGSGWGLRGTYPAAMPALLRVPIDHAFASPSMVIKHLSVAPNFGGDHRAIAVGFHDGQP